MSFKDLPADARPREKLMAHGAAALATPSCWRCCCAPACPARTCCSSPQELLDRFGGLAGLLHAGLDDLKRIKGLGGTAKRAELPAVLELARRALAERLKERAVFDSPEAVKHYLQLHLGRAAARSVRRPLPRRADTA